MNQTTPAVQGLNIPPFLSRCGSRASSEAAIARATTKAKVLVVTFHCPYPYEGYPFLPPMN